MIMSSAGQHGVTRVLRHARVTLPDRSIEADVLLRAGRILTLTPPGKGRGDEVWDLEGLQVAAGLVDTHTHGGWGIDFSSDSMARILTAGPLYARAGVTRLLPTLLPAPEEDLLEQLANLARVCDADPSTLVGIHLEGPFLARDRRGALPEVGILPYDEGLASRLLEAGGGHLRVMTFAPEAIPADAIPRIQSTGVTLSIGHTAADAATTEGALESGVRRATHLCNAMRPLHHRAPGPVVPLLLDSRVRVEVIVDGHHLDDRFLALILAQKGSDGVLAVSDSSPVAGLGPCQGTLGGVAVTSDGARTTLADGTLAGSATPLLDALLRTGRKLGLAPERLWRLGATVPACDLPLSGLGRVASGAPADLIVLTDSGEIVATLRGGQRADDLEVSDWLPPAIQRIE